MALTIKPVSRDNIKKEEALKEIRKDKAVKLTINIPESLRSKFKIVTIRNGTDMSEVILNWIEEYVG